MPALESTRTPRSHDALLDSLAAIVDRFTPIDGEHAVAIPSLTFYRFSAPTQREADFSKIALILAVQGAKTITVGDDVFDYDTGHYLLTSLAMPVAGSVREASSDEPYMSLVFELEMKYISDLVASPNLPRPDEPPTRLGIGRGEVSIELLEAIYRLVRLLDTPKHIPSLAPLAEREIVYRLMMGSQGARLREALISGSRAFRIAKAVEWIKAHYDEPVRIDDLAQHANMSLSSLHQHFKDATSLSPLQYQKRLRLFAARRLLLERGSDVRIVASSVGYDNLSQFHREYKRLFGSPPVQDALRLRSTS